MTWNMALELSDGFVVYRTGWDADEWIEVTVAEAAATGDLAGELRQVLRKFTDWAIAKDDVDVELWLGGIAVGADGSPLLTLMGSVSIGELADVAEVARQWRAAQAEGGAVSSDVVVAQSRRAPVVAAHEIYLRSTDGGEPLYREWGLAIRAMPRHGLSVRLEVDSPDLTAVASMPDFLIELIRGISLTEVEVAR